MKTKRKIVYYCDFCKKRALRSLAQHEKYCTGNPDRECRLCENQSIREIIEKYKGYFSVSEEIHTEHEWNEAKPIFKKNFTLEDIINELDYRCPNCILAIIRALGLNRWYFDKKFDFDYKKELEDWWKMNNEETYREDDWEG